MSSRVIVLAGPSGAGKSLLAARVGLPVLRLDDFYREGDDPGLPTVGWGRNTVVDWDDPRSWDRDAALATLEALWTTGRGEIPVYDLATSRRTGSRTLDLHGCPTFVAEGIFAQEIVAACRDRGHLLAAYCLTQPPWVTFGRRLLRDLAEHRKSAWVLVRRGLVLLRAQPAVVAHARDLGCEVVDPDTALDRIRALVDRADG